MLCEDDGDLNEGDAEDDCEKGDCCDGVVMKFT